MNVVVEHSGEQVVRGSDGVEVTGKMQIQILHRYYLGVSAAGGSALNTENRSEGGFSQSDYALFPSATQTVGQTDCCCSFAFAGGGR